MSIVQQNYKKVYKCKISIFETKLGLKTEILYTYKPFLRKKNLAYIKFNLYQPIKAYDCKHN